MKMDNISGERHGSGSIKQLAKEPLEKPSVKKPTKKSIKRSVKQHGSGAKRVKQLRVLVAPDSFKDSLSADKVAIAIRKGILLASPSAHVVMLPLADGGEGTLDAIRYAILDTGSGGAKKGAVNGVPDSAVKGRSRGANSPRWVTRSVRGPLDKNVKAKYLEISSCDIGDPVLRKKLGTKTPSIAIIEMAQAAGFQLLLPSERNPMLTSTFGVGELIKDALDRGIKTIVLTIGGSATNDGGTGMAAALGFRFLDDKGRPILPRGGELEKIADIDDSQADPRIRSTRFFVAADVTNPFYGPKGAAFIYGPQKGASQAQVKKLDKGLLCLARAIKKKYNIDLQKVTGSGAAGGLGGAATTFLGAKMLSGIQFIAQICDLKGKAKDVDLCIVAEGRFDRQSLSGKAAVGIAGLVAPIPVVLLAGSIGIGARELAKEKTPILAALSIQNGPMSIQESKIRTAELLADAGFHSIRIFLSGAK